jgi:quercetin dioxygenase-like cupin family protein
MSEWNGDTPSIFKENSMKRSTLASFQNYQEKGFSKINLYKDGNTNIFTLNFLPGQYMPEHYHPGAQLIFHVLAGTGVFIVDGEEHEVTKDDILHVLGTEEVGFLNTGEDSAAIYVSLFSRPSEENR